MNFKKFIVPAMASLAVFTSCNSGVKLVKDQYPETIYDTYMETLKASDVTDTTLNISNTKGNIIAKRLTIESETRYDINKMNLSLNNLNATFNLKLANLLKYYQGEDKTKVDYSKNPIISTSELKNVSANGTLSLNYDNPTSGEEDIMSLDFNENIDSIKSYIARNLMENEEKVPTLYGRYIDLSSNDVSTSLGNLIDNAKSKVAKKGDVYAKLALYLQQIKDRLYVENKYAFTNENATGERLHEKSGMINKAITNLSKEEEKEAFMTDLQDKLGTFIVKAGNDNVFSIMRNDNTYTYTITLNKDALQNLCNNGSDEPYAKITSGEIKAVIKTDNNNRFTNATFTVNGLTASSNYAIEKSPISVSRFMFKDFSTNISLDYKYDTTLDAITKIVNDATSNTEDWSYKYYTQD